ncbi:protein flc expressor [Quercus suber]|uniref:Protein flc expressor n=1 Tax=Quercus suber TaxID=58331 RepID=A0AAW0LAM5_QUESU
MSRRNHHREIQVPLSRIEDRRGGLLLHGSRSHHPHSLILEDRIAIQHREIQSLLGDNQQLASAHVALKHDLSAAQHDLRVLSVTASDIKAERDAEIRDLGNFPIRQSVKKIQNPPNNKTKTRMRKRR